MTYTVSDKEARSTFQETFVSQRQALLASCIGRVRQFRNMLQAVFAMFPCNRSHIMGVKRASGCGREQRGITGIPWVPLRRSNRAQQASRKLGTELSVQGSEEFSSHSNQVLNLWNKSPPANIATWGRRDPDGGFRSVWLHQVEGGAGREGSLAWVIGDQS